MRFGPLESGVQACGRDICRESEMTLIRGKPTWQAQCAEGICERKCQHRITPRIFGAMLGIAVQGLAGLAEPNELRLSEQAARAGRPNTPKCCDGFP